MIVNNRSHVLVAVEGIEEASKVDKQVLEMKSLNFENERKINQITCMDQVNTVELIWKLPDLPESSEMIFD